jgi:hypothetical protein
MSGIWVQNTEGMIETTSRLRVWWLHSIRGCEIVEEKLRPRQGSFGRVSYERAWVLKEKGKKT